MRGPPAAPPIPSSGCPASDLQVLPPGVKWRWLEPVARRYVVCGHCGVTAAHLMQKVGQWHQLLPFQVLLVCNSLLPRIRIVAFLVSHLRFRLPRPMTSPVTTTSDACRLRFRTLTVLLLPSSGAKEWQSIRFLCNLASRQMV